MYTLQTDIVKSAKNWAKFVELFGSGGYLRIDEDTYFMSTSYGLSLETKTKEGELVVFRVKEERATIEHAPTDTPLELLGLLSEIAVKIAEYHQRELEPSLERAKEELKKTEAAMNKLQARVKNLQEIVDSGIVNSE